MPIITLRSLYTLFARHKEGNWVMIPQNAQLLYEFVKTHPIKRVLDLGTGIGCSSAIIALALRDKGETDYHIDSVEQFDKCIKIANELIPEEFKISITIHKANVEIWKTPEIPYQYFSIYDKLPEGDYDLWLNDGPSPILEEERFVELPNGTVHKLTLENKIKPGTMIAYDGRIQSIRLLERYFGDNFFLVKPGEKSHFNVLERKDNPVKVLDDKLEMMKQLGYFSE